MCAYRIACTTKQPIPLLAGLARQRRASWCAQHAKKSTFLILVDWHRVQVIIANETAKIGAFARQAAACESIRTKLHLKG
jgi:hypothetical protein